MEISPCKMTKQLSDVMEVNKQDDFSFNNECLPDEIIEEIFKYLNLYDMWRARRVCKQWYNVSKSPMFWKRVNTNFEPHNKFFRLKTLKFVEMLPSCVTHLRLYMCDVSLAEISIKLQERCPNLQVLIFENAILTYIKEDRKLISRLLEQSTGNLSVLSLHHSTLLFTGNTGIRCPTMARERLHCQRSKALITLPYKTTTNASNPDVLDVPCSYQMTKSSPEPNVHPCTGAMDVPKIEVLDISRSCEMGTNALTLATKLPHLKKLGLSGCTVTDHTICRFSEVIPKLQVLDLEGTLVGAGTLSKLWGLGKNLTELYVCFTSLQDTDFMFQNETSLFNLKIICLRQTSVSYECIKRLIRSCQSLKSVYISGSNCECMKDSHEYTLAQIHFDDTYMYCDHFKKINYLHDF